jgi:hypothetical protein
MIGSLPDISAAGNGILLSAGRAVTQYTSKAIAERCGAQANAPRRLRRVRKELETWT